MQSMLNSFKRLFPEKNKGLDSTQAKSICESCALKAKMDAGTKDRHFVLHFSLEWTEI